MTEDTQASVSAMMAGAGIPGDGEQCLLATIADELYAFDLAGIREILRTAAKERAPGAPPFVAGLINLRGDIVTVIDVAYLLGIRGGTEQSLESRIVVIEGAGEVVGVQVDHLHEIIRYDPATVQLPRIAGDHRCYEYLKGIFTRPDGGSAILLDMNALCTEKTETALAG